jgi:murein DD-endopeptidase MepM/ murein hydrolase activator NlpD
MGTAAETRIPQGVCPRANPANWELETMRSTSKRRARIAGSGLVGSVLIIGLAAVPARAEAAPDPQNGWTLTSAAIPQLTDPFQPILDIDAERAEQEQLAAEAQEEATAAKRQRAEERREKAAAAARKRLNRKYVPLTGDFNLTARFGDWGWYWSGGRHTGLDFAAPTGTDVGAAQAGKVIAAGWAGAYGQRLEIRHADGTVTSYNHLATLLVGVGDVVGGGQHIGDVGSTGNVTGSHLHLEVTNRSGSFIDPAAWLGLG